MQNININYELFISKGFHKKEDIIRSIFPLIENEFWVNIIYKDAPLNNKTFKTSEEFQKFISLCLSEHHSKNI